VLRDAFCTLCSARAWSKRVPVAARDSCGLRDVIESKRVPVHGQAEIEFGANLLIALWRVRRPEVQLILAFADQEAAAYALGKGWPQRR
jgi:hypothetical protein